MIRARVCAALLLAGMCVLDGRAQTPGVPHAASLRGDIVSPICSSEAFAAGEIMGDLSGTFSIAFDCGSDGRIASGTWYIAVMGAGLDGVVTELGTIGGLVRSGSFESDSAGTFVSLRSVELAVTHGTGAYAVAASGTGTLQAASDPNGTPQFLGTVALSF